jgi:hypothetical protein
MMLNMYQRLYTLPTLGSVKESIYHIVMTKVSSTLGLRLPYLQKLVLVHLYVVLVSNKGVYTIPKKKFHNLY